MVQSLTSAQESALALDSQKVVYAVEINLTSDLCYCTGLEQITLDGTDYTPRALEVTGVNVTDPRSSRETVTIDDLDGAIASVWYSERFSGQTVTITEAIYDDNAWVSVRTIPWVCDTVQRQSGGRIVLNLNGAGGLRPRAGLEVGARANWHLAPEPGTSIQIGHTATTVG